MIYRCRCGRTKTASPYKLSIVKVMVCESCYKKLQGRKRIRLSFRPNSLRGGIGIRVRLKI